MASILFVCTGNIFRSMTAEYSLKKRLADRPSISVSSAGTRDDPDLQIRKDVSDYLLTYGLDVSSHKRTFITPDLIANSDLVIAMHIDHKDLLRRQFSIDAPHFMEACGKSDEALPDIDDLFPPDEWHGPEAQHHIRTTIDKIIEMTPRLFSKYF